MSLAGTEPALTGEPGRDEAGMAEPSQVKPAWQRGGAAHTPSQNFQTYVQIFLGFPSVNLAHSGTFGEQSQ